MIGGGGSLVNAVLGCQWKLNNVREMEKRSKHNKRWDKWTNDFLCGGTKSSDNFKIPNYEYSVLFTQYKYT